MHEHEVEWLSALWEGDSHALAEAAWRLRTQLMAWLIRPTTIPRGRDAAAWRPAVAGHERGTV